jgi:hypothetical protein
MEICQQIGLFRVPLIQRMVYGNWALRMREDIKVTFRNSCRSLAEVDQFSPFGESAFFMLSDDRMRPLGMAHT